MNLKERFEHIELPAKLLDYFLQSNKSNINQSTGSSRCVDYLTAMNHKHESFRCCGPSKFLHSPPMTNEVAARWRWLCGTRRGGLTQIRASSTNGGGFQKHVPSHPRKGTPPGDTPIGQFWCNGLLKIKDFVLVQDRPSGLSRPRNAARRHRHSRQRSRCSLSSCRCGTKMQVRQSAVAP